MMKSRNVIIFVLITIILLIFLIPNNNSNDPALYPNFSIIQPYYKSLLNDAANHNLNNDDFFLAILGSDEREDEASRSDVIILTKYNEKENKLIVVSVPRDSKIVIPGKGFVKINAAYAYGGPKLQVSILEELFKVKNVRYIHVNFDGFIEIVNKLGGVKINAKKDFMKSSSHTVYAKKGENILMGEDLLRYVSFRKDRDGDFGRIERQQEVILALASSSLNPKNIVNLPKVALLITQNSDSDMDIFFIMNKLKSLKRLDLLKFEFYTLKTQSEYRNGIWFEIIDQKNLEFISNLLQN